MADDADQAWSEVGQKFSSWGHRIAARYRDAGATAATSADDTERELQRVAKEVVDELARGFSAVGKTLRDDQANQDLGAAFTAIGDAITAIVNEASRAVRSGGSGDTPPAKGSASPPDDPTDRS